MLKNVIYITIAIIFVLAYLRYFEHRSLYFPTKEIEFTPRDVGLAYEALYIDTDRGMRLNAWFVPAADSRYTLLFCHGNGGNIGHRIDKIAILNRLGLDILIFDYRGYGLSSGRPSEKGLYKDAEASYDYLVYERKISPERIILYGESLGGAVAVELATKRHAKAIITECLFSSTKDVAKIFYPFFPTFIISSKFDSSNKIRSVKIPKLIIHSTGDEIIPFNQSVKLFKLSSEPKRHLALKGSHNTCYQDSRDLYTSGISEFLRGL